MIIYQLFFIAFYVNLNNKFSNKFYYIFYFFLIIWFINKLKLLNNLKPYFLLCYLIKSLDQKLITIKFVLIFFYGQTNYKLINTFYKFSYNFLFCYFNCLKNLET